jgi:L,D-transpeptidase ErfK/SrfK
MKFPLESLHGIRFVRMFSSMLIALLVTPVAGAVERSPLNDLRTTVSSLEQQAAQLKFENSRLKNTIAAQNDDELYVVVDIESNRLTLRRGERVEYAAVCGTGSRQLIQSESGKKWEFETPLGVYTVLTKERNPVWIKPDWAFVEENLPIPPERDPSRIVREVLGKYALLLGGGYKIHGTKLTRKLGTRFTHGCVSLGDRDLEYVYRTVPIGAKVYLY